jgi:ribonuclease BN (tRNA processing enzyme)
MGVRLTVIGCSPAWPNPGSAHSGYLVENESGGRLLLDCGPGVLARLREHRLLPLDAIAISHFHLDHWGDLVAWCWLAASGYEDVGRAELWLPPGGRNALVDIAGFWGHRAMFDGVFRVREYVPGESFTAAGFEVVAHPVEHYGLAAFGLQVGDGGGRTLAYSGDTGPCHGLLRLAEAADLLVCEATLQNGAEDSLPRGHLSAEEAVAAASGRILLTHRPAELPTPAGAERARDGLVTEV